MYEYLNILAITVFALAGIMIFAKSASDIQKNKKDREKKISNSQKDSQ